LGDLAHSVLQRDIFRDGKVKKFQVRG
jgi:hypothetical protein